MRRLMGAVLVLGLASAGDIVGGGSTATAQTATGEMVFLHEDGTEIPRDASGVAVGTVQSNELLAVRTAGGSAGECWADAAAHVPGVMKWEVWGSDTPGSGELVESGAGSVNPDGHHEHGLRLIASGDTWMYVDFKCVHPDDRDHVLLEFSDLKVFVVAGGGPGIPPPPPPPPPSGSDQTPPSTPPAATPVRRQPTFTG